jgi:HSP20 family molecular chaperone IbpA
MMKTAELIRVKYCETPHPIFDKLKRDLAEWMTTDRDFMWRPTIELMKMENQYKAMVLLPGVDAKNVAVSVAPEILLVEGVTRNGQTFMRSVTFPKPINPRSVRLEFRDGVLSLMAAIAAAELPMLRAA